MQKKNPKKHTHTKQSYLEIANYPVFPLTSHEKSQCSSLKMNNVISYFETQNVCFSRNIFIFWTFKI